MTTLMRNPLGATMQEMKANLPCSERSIYRLIKMMTDLDVPVHQSWDIEGNTNSKRWKILESEWKAPFASIPDPRTTLLVKMMLSYVNKNKSDMNSFELKNIQADLKKSDILRSLTQERLKFLKTNYTTFKGYKDYTGKEALISCLSENIQNQTGISITYHSPKNAEPKQYQIHPYTIVSHDNGLYLLAAVPKHDGNVIVLAIERIVSIDQEHAEHFMIPESYDPELKFKNTFGITIEEPMDVLVRFDKEAAFYAGERIWGQNQMISASQDGSIELAFTASGLKEICRWILSYGKHALALKPAKLIEELRQETRGMEDFYS